MGLVSRQTSGFRLRDEGKALCSVLLHKGFRAPYGMFSCQRSKVGLRRLPTKGDRFDGALERDEGLSARRRRSDRGRIFNKGPGLDENPPTHGACCVDAPIMGGGKVRFSGFQARFCKVAASVLKGGRSRGVVFDFKNSKE